jgi:hypothetical protein
MSKDEIRYEINKVLGQLSDKSLKDLLDFLKKVERRKTSTLFDGDNLKKILSEDKELLEKLAK